MATYTDRQDDEEIRAAAAEEETLDAVARHEAWLLTEGADYLFENGHGE